MSVDQTTFCGGFGAGAWRTLLARLQGNRRRFASTVLIGPEICPKLAKEFRLAAKSIVKPYVKKESPYLGDEESLSAVAQHIFAETGDGTIAKDHLSTHIEDRNHDLEEIVWRSPDQPYRILADLPFRIYITTNYDKLLYDVLDKNPTVDPRLAVCRWHDAVSEENTIRDDEEYVPTIANPLLFHLFGWVGDVPSLAISDDDLIDLLIAASEEREVIPTIVKGALRQGTLLLLGFDPSSLHFRVVLRLIASYLRIDDRCTYSQCKHLTVLHIAGSRSDVEVTQRFYSKLLTKHPRVRFDVEWCTCARFLMEFRDRWEREKDKL